MIDDLARGYAVDGFELAWDRWGPDDGVPLVLCHGFSGSTHDFALQIEALAQERPVVSIDHRGHGRSSKSGVDADYTVEHVVGDVTAWIDAEVGGPVDLLGHSMGGRVAMRLALRRPDLLRSLILMDTTAWKFGVDDPEVAALATAFFEGLTPGTDFAVPPTDEDPLIEATTTTAWQVTKAEHQAGFDIAAARALGTELFADRLPPVGDRLGEITVPVTVIVGELDGLIADHAPRLADGVADGELVTIDGAYHSPQLTHPDAWRDALRRHFSRLD